jgi:hypothetical protein
MHSKSCVWQLIIQNLAIAFILFFLQRMETIYICNSKIWIRVCGGSEENHLIERDGTITLLPNEYPL